MFILSSDLKVQKPAALLFLKHESFDVFRCFCPVGQASAYAFNVMGQEGVGREVLQPICAVLEVFRRQRAGHGADLSMFIRILVQRLGLAAAAALAAGRTVCRGPVYAAPMTDEEN